MYLYQLAMSVLLVLFMGSFGIAVGTMMELMIGMIELKRKWTK